MNILSVYIDDILSKKEITPNIYLCKPDRSRIRKLKDIYNLKLNLKLGAINELSFTTPSFIDRNHELIKNPLISDIKLYYLVEFQFKGTTEYFVVMSQNKSMSNDEEVISYNLFSLGYLLNNKLIKIYEATSYTLSQLVFDFLEETDWGIDHIDVDFDVNNSNALKRSYETDNSTVLQCLFEVAEKFNAIVYFDTVYQKVSFYNPEKIGLNRGWRLKKGKYLESYNVDINIDEIVTRMYCYGSEGLEFRSLSPTGSNYLEDFSWYMYPFKCDDNYKVIEHSEYMTDALCIALIKYNKLLSQNASKFKELSTSLSTKKAELTTLNQELSALDTELTMLNNELDVINATYLDNAPSKQEWQSVISKINSKKSQITSKTNQITTKEKEIKNTESSISALHDLLNVENNFKKEEILELNKYIIQRDFTDDTIVEEQDLLDASTKHFKTINEPAITMSFSIANFLNDMEYVADRDKINLGDTVKLISETLDVSISSKIIEISFDFDNNDISLVIANDKDLQDDDSKLTNMIYSSHNTSTTVNMNKYKLDLAVNANNLVTHMINSEFDTAKNVLVGGTENSNTMNERGFYSNDFKDDNTYLVINNGILAITKNSGNSVEVAISKNGVHAEKLAGKLILGNKLVIQSDLGLFEINGATQTIYDANGVKKVEIGRYKDPNNTSQYKYGVNVIDGAIDIRTSSNANRGTQLDGNGFRAFNSNGVRTFNVNAATGQVEIIGDLTIKSSPSSYRGVVITSSGITGYNASGGITFELNANSGKMTSQESFLIQTSTSPNRGVKIDDYGIRGYNTSGTKTFEIDVYGNATFSGNITASSIYGTTISGGSISGTTITGNTINGGSINGTTITGSTINGNEIYGGTISGTTITGNTINGGTINGTTINGTTITSADINISEEATIGNWLNLGTRWNDPYPKGIRFGGGAGGSQISFKNDMINISAMSGVNIPEGSLYIGNETAVTSNYTDMRLVWNGAQGGEKGGRLYVRSYRGEIGYIELKA
ncbi:phage tail protein [Lysinibacillus sp. Bpr_S20]|uniref:phage tail protein n=1 Tax=Lysinibacillus sp. Bpr_S20 TaxID=2933964 RepID=UPI002013A99C|nr:phage tail protein [Lysinibacillus sp. Bpr_S20]MCL1700852.1 phage tail protein [Lysinibacillus sp. Bpr_S20]